MRLNIGQILKSKKGQVYIKLDDNITEAVFKGKVKVKGDEQIVEIKLKGGDSIFPQTPADKFNFLIENEYIEAQKGEEMLERYAKGGDLDFVKYFIELNDKK